MIPHSAFSFLFRMRRFLSALPLFVFFFLLHPAVMAAADADPQQIYLDQYWVYFLVAAFFLVGQTVLIAVLIWCRQRTKRAEAARRETDELLHSYLASSGIISWLKDVDGRYLFISDPLKQRFQVRFEDWKGKTDSELWPPAVAEEFRRNDLLVLESGQRLEVIETAFEPDGRVSWWKNSKFPFLDASGKRCVGGLGFDITELKKAQQAVEDERRLMADILDATDVMLVYLDPRFNFVAVNKAYADTCRMTPAEMIGKNHFSCYPNEETEAIFRQVRDTGFPVFFKDKPFEFPDKPERGVTYWDWSLSPIKDAAGVVQGLVFSLRETTKYKLAELAIQESEERYRRILATALEGIVITDRNYCISYVNQRINKLMGYEADELIGMPVPRLLHDDDRQDFSAKMADRRRGEGDQYEYRYRRKDGSFIWLLTSATPIFDGEGVFQGSFAMFTDLTGRKQAEAERLEFERKMMLSQKLESLGVMAGGIAHDFNNLLMVIMGNAELARYELPPESPVQAHLRHIGESSRRAAEISQQMLTYTGKDCFLAESVDCNKLIVESEQLMRAAVAKNVNLVFRLAPQLPPVKADKVQIRQALMNLVMNASEASGDDGTITVGTGWKTLGRNSRTDVPLNDAIDEAGYSFIEVADSGCGMDREMETKIFDPFFTTKFIGRGLGLSEVQGIVRGHQGLIEVHSEPGKGSVFRILLPVDEEPKMLESEPGAQELDFPGNKTVLLVDDEKDVRDIASWMLERMGFTVITANDGEEALSVFKENPDPAFVLLDLSMPRMNGEQCFRELRRLDPSVRVIITSGYSEREIIGRFAGRSLSGYIQKPFTLSKLREVIQPLYVDS
ncbi:MAG: hypothetical protein BM485_14920 [Desulfobulbaceae bacterium DB1]|nr:MAG: hypothetical protein BM485_14920 [Desulfobulbaceae bacterium DB1]